MGPSIAPALADGETTTLIRGLLTREPPFPQVPFPARFHSKRKGQGEVSEMDRVTPVRSKKKSRLAKNPALRLNNESLVGLRRGLRD